MTDREMSTWRPIVEAPRDGTAILCCLRADLVAHTGWSQAASWAGVQVPMRHGGYTTRGINRNWRIAAPVWREGFPDDWIAGWMPLPAPPWEGTTA